MGFSRRAGQDMRYDQDPDGRVESQADGDPRPGDPASDAGYVGGPTADADTGARSTRGAEEALAPNAGGSDDPAGAAAANDQRDRYLRLAAEYDNYRKRATRERQEAGARAQAELVKQLIDALDDLSRFAHLDPATTDPTALTQGVDMVERKLLKALGAAGLEIVNPLDQAFDPNLHEAVATERALSREDDHLVARVYQPGYVFNGQLLRPARVVVKQWNG
jgi:molecular chaperone GrpE